MRLDRLATQAVRAAAQLRAELGIGPADAVCPFDLAERMRIVVRLVASPSIEGMYVPGERPAIFIGAERPAGRRRFTCGHEIGHHQFGHGERIDEIDNNDPSWAPEEFLAQRFAAALLMPKLAVDSAFARRGWSARSPAAEDAFIVAQDLGVGYATLINHMERTLRCIPNSVADDLRRTGLPRLRSRIAGFKVEEDLVVVDGGWGRRPLDLEVGDIALIPHDVHVDGCYRSRQLMAFRSRHPMPITLASTGPAREHPRDGHHRGGRALLARSPRRWPSQSCSIQKGRSLAASAAR